MAKGKQPKIKSGYIPERDRTPPKIKGGSIPEQNRTPRLASSQTSNSEKPSWRFAMLQLTNPFGWHELDKGKLVEIHSKLCEMEVLTWNEILIERKHFNHTINKDQICAEAQKRLEEMNQDDIDELVSLRLGGTERVWGIRDKSIFRLLWWDPAHLIYPSEKKHT